MIIYWECGIDNCMRCKDPQTCEWCDTGYFLSEEGTKCSSNNHELLYHQKRK